MQRNLILPLLFLFLTINLASAQDDPVNKRDILYFPDQGKITLKFKVPNVAKTQKVRFQINDERLFKEPVKISAELLVREDKTLAVDISFRNPENSFFAVADPEASFQGKINRILNLGTLTIKDLPKVEIAFEKASAQFINQDSMSVNLVMKQDLEKDQLSYQVPPRIFVVYKGVTFSCKTGKMEALYFTKKLNFRVSRSQCKGPGTAWRENKKLKKAFRKGRGTIYLKGLEVNFIENFQSLAGDLSELKSFWVENGSRPVLTLLKKRIYLKK